MPYPLHNKLVVRGVFGSTDEIWTYSLKFKSEVDVGGDVVPGDWDQGAIATALVAFHHTANFSAGTEVTEFRGYQIGADGLTVGDNLIRSDPITGGAGTGSRVYPPQVACVVSLLGASRGPASHGRAYMPGPNFAVSQTTQTIATSDADNFLSSFKTLVEALKDAMYDVTVLNEAMVNVSPSGGGVLQEVATYRCGLVLDTVRSRRNKLAEQYRELAA